MRLFVAVDPGDRLRAELTPRLDAWRRRWDLRWVAPANLHITLKFLGEWSREGLPALEEALHEAVRERPCFTLHSAGLDVFPDWRRPRVLFLQLRGDGALEETAAAVARGVDWLGEGGAVKSSPFRAHLTLARIRRPLSSPDAAALRETASPASTELEIGDIRLIESRLRPGGPTYTTLRTFPLATSRGI